MSKACHLTNQSPRGSLNRTLTEVSRLENHMTLAETIRAAQLPAPAIRRSIRENAGATRREVADELGVTPLTVSRWESGTSEPRRERAIAYRRVLDSLMAVTQ